MFPTITSWNCRPLSRRRRLSSNYQCRLLPVTKSTLSPKLSKISHATLGSWFLLNDSLMLNFRHHNILFNHISRGRLISCTRSNFTNRPRSLTLVSRSRPFMQALFRLMLCIRNGHSFIDISVCHWFCQHWRSILLNLHLLWALLVLLFILYFSSTSRFLRCWWFVALFDLYLSVVVKD